MYRLSPAGKPEGVLNDYDLASWKKHPTVNSDRTGTVPFMSLNMLNDGLDNRIPRLYKHDAESFTWVLAYITVVNVEYKSCSVKIYRPQLIDPWFTGDPQSHFLAKCAFPIVYGGLLPVTEPYKPYVSTIWTMIDYWVQSHKLEAAGLTKPETGDPRNALEKMVQDVEVKLGADAQREFAKIKTLLLEAIAVPEVV